MRHTVIEANNKKVSLGLRELFDYRDLFWILAYRDYRVRYAQTFLGFAWAFLQPLATLIIFTVVFGKAAKVDTGDIPYPLFAICGMSAWSYFSFVLSQSGNSIIGAQNMIKKIYFPRLIIPLSKAVVGCIDFGITLIFIVGLMVYYQFIPSSNIVFLPLFLLITIVSSLAIGIWFNSLTIRFRDFQYVIPFVVQFGLYATPTAYPASSLINKLPEWGLIAYYLNPMAGVVEGFRWCLLGTQPPSAYSYLSFVIAISLLILGLFYFKRTEKVMADLV